MKVKFKKVIFLFLVLLATVSLVACGGSNQDKAVEELEDKSVEVEGKDKSSDLEFERSMELSFAEHFKVDYYKGGYKIITDASDRKILLIPQGMEVPDTDDEVMILEEPVETFGVYSTIDPSWFRPLDEVARIRTVTFEEEKWKTEEMRDRVKNGEAIYIGSGDSLDYELLSEINPSLNLLSKSNEEKLFPKFDELGLPYLSMGSYLESDPRARLEWTKLIGALLDKEDMAEEYFQEELARIDEVERLIDESDMEKPNVTMAYFSGSSQEFKITNIEGYKVKQMEMAGGSYYPPDMGLDKRGSTSVTPEEFFKIMNETDILIYDSVSGHEIESLDDMIEKADYLADSKVFKEGRIWGLKRDFWQAGEKVADMTEEYYEIFYRPHGEVEETKYFYLMK